MDRVRSFGWRRRSPGYRRESKEAGPETPALRRGDRAVTDPVVSIASRGTRDGPETYTIRFPSRNLEPIMMLLAEWPYTDRQR